MAVQIDRWHGVSQTSVIFVTLAIGFVIYITLKGELKYYVGVIAG